MSTHIRVTARELIASDESLEEIVRVLKEYQPEKIILFGSRARGQSDEYSDYDLILIKRTKRAFLDRMQDIVPYLVKIPYQVEVLIYTPEEFEHMAEIGFGWMVKQEGVVIYERSSN